MENLSDYAGFDGFGNLINKESKQDFPIKRLPIPISHIKLWKRIISMTPLDYDVQQDSNNGSQ